MPVHGRASGVWEVTRPRAKVSGTWKYLNAVYGRVAGVWERVYHPINLDGHSVSHTTQTGTAQAGYRFNTDGTVDKREGTAHTQIDGSTDWIFPGTAAPGSYQIFVSHTGTALSPSSDSLDTWLTLTSSRTWFMSKGTGTGTQSCVLTISIREGTGATLDSGTYNIEITREGGGEE